MAGTVLITGASSGIGKALALRYAREGRPLALIGRDRARLDGTAEECRRLGGKPQCGLIDVRSRDAMSGWIRTVDDANPVDLVIANAGLMAGTPPDGPVEPPDAGHGVIETNVLGVLNTVQPLIGPMMARRRGTIAIVSSIAAFIPLPDSPSYCASKSAVLSYGLSLRALLAPHGIGVSVICPGYVKTPMMMRESGPKPFVMAPERAVARIVAGLERNRPVISFPFFFALATRMHGLMPDRLRRILLRGTRFTVAD